MITKVIIDGFKGLKNTEYDFGQDTIITGKNGSGKSRIIEAIIYCLTGEVNGYKKKLECSVSIQGSTINTARVNGKIFGTTRITDQTKFLCGVVPGYINSLTIKDRIKVLTGINQEGQIPFSNCGFISYEDYNARLSQANKLVKIVDDYSERMVSNLEEINKLGNTEVGDLTDIKDKYDKIVNLKAIETRNKGILEINQAKQERILELEKQLEGFDSSVDLDFIRQGIIKKIREYDSIINKIEYTKGELKLAEDGNCPMCSQSLPNEELIVKVKAELSKLKKEAKDIEITRMKLALKKIDLDIVEYDNKMKINRELGSITAMEECEAADPIEYTEEEFEELKIKLDNFQELFANQQRKQLLEQDNKILGEKIKESNLGNTQANLDKFQEAEKRYFKELSFDFDFDITLYKNNKTNSGGNLVYEISKDGVDYFWLSSAQKLLIDTQIAMHISKNNASSKFLLVDNGERLTNDNQKKLLQLIGDKQIILTRVSQVGLKLEID